MVEARHEQEERYARPAIRLRAALYDYALFLVALVATLALANAAGPASNAIFLVGALLIALYDPVLVSWRGSTIGHQICNLRVVDDRLQTCPGFFKSVLRCLIKTLLGWLSFLTIVTSKRMKAVHDLATGTSVQVRDRSRMVAAEFSQVRSLPVGMKLPSATRRGAGILLYAGVSYLVLSVSLAAAAATGLISSECIDDGHCTGANVLFIGIAGLAWLASLFVIAGLGWWGRLPGFRVKRIQEGEVVELEQTSASNPNNP